MAACGSLQHIFIENSLPESPTFLESLSPWKAIKNMKPVSNCTFTEIFGELHFKENHRHHHNHDHEHDHHDVVSESSSHSSSSSSSSPSVLLPPESSPSSSSVSPSPSPSLFAELDQQDDGIERVVERSKSPTSSYSCPSAATQKKHYKHSDSFSSMNSESLSLCTEGLGFESSDDVEDLGNDHSRSFDQFQQQQPDSEKNLCFSSRHSSESFWKESTKRSRTSKGTFPPPISCIGRTGKPWVCFKSYRQDGRFILQEIRFPTQEFLHACREDGRLRLQYIQSDDEILEEDEEEEDDDDSFDAADDDVNKENIVDDFDENHDQNQEGYNVNDADDDESVEINNVVQDSSE